MQNNRIRFVPSEDALKLLDHRPDLVSVSRLISSVIERYQALVRNNTPQLSSEEWLLLFDAVNGASMWDTPASIGALEYEVQDAIEYEGEKWNVGKEFHRRVAAMSYAEKMAIVDVSERFWARYGNSAVGIDEALQALGARR